MTSVVPVLLPLPTRRSSDLNLGKPALHIEFIEDDWHEVFVSYQPSRSIAWLGELQNHFNFLQQRRRTVQSRTPVSERCPHLRHQLRRIGRTQIDEQGQDRKSTRLNSSHVA